VVPYQSRGYYAERIAYMPESFQPNDPWRAGSESARAMTSAPNRRDAGLPDTGLVLCSFNNSYKLNPLFFDIWMRLLQQTPDSVLWLLGGESGTEDRLRAEARSRGVITERLVFARRVPYEAHLARLSLADLFLDTLPFNAGATASDALWSGVPVLTCAGQAFAARMAGSLLNALSLPELITFTPDDYERRALELLRDRPRLEALKLRLTAGRRDRALFDIARYCRDLEAAYLCMWTQAQAGDPPSDFAVIRSIEAAPPRAVLRS
jgi:predicted O-linked N-acetylglucosamine transferase (SPINDLY family)